MLEFNIEEYAYTCTIKGYLVISSSLSPGGKCNFTCALYPPLI